MPTKTKTAKTPKTTDNPPQSALPDLGAIVDRDKLKTALDIAKGYVMGRTTLPILQNVLVGAYDNKVWLVGTNLNHAIRIGVDAQVNGEWSVCPPYRLLADLVAASSSKTLTLSVQNQKSPTVAGMKPGNILDIAEEPDRRGRFSVVSHLNTTFPDDFPGVPSRDTFGEAFVMRVNGAEFAEAVKQVEFAAARDESRPLLTCVHMVLNRAEATVTVEATDGFRMSQRVIRTCAPVYWPSTLYDHRVLVPYQTLKEAARLRLDATTDVDILVGYGRAQTMFVAGDIEVVSHTMDGQFPDTSQIIPQTSNVQVVLSRTMLASALKRVGLFAARVKDKNNNAPTYWTIRRDGVIQIVGKDSEGGETTCYVDAEVRCEAEEFVFGVNFVYAKEALDALKTDDIILHMGPKASDPLMFCEATGLDFRHVVVPIHVTR
jgi:DNA polymerase-3 subunit beta